MTNNMQKIVICLYTWRWRVNNDMAGKVVSVWWRSFLQQILNVNIFSNTTHFSHIEFTNNFKTNLVPTSVFPYLINQASKKPKPVNIK